jgi:hypothetical protein
MHPEENVLLRAHRLLPESTEIGRQCTEFYERQDQAEQARGQLVREMVSSDTQEFTLSGDIS